VMIFRVSRGWRVEFGRLPDHADYSAFHSAEPCIRSRRAIG
jgi:hypothetical protein